MPGNKHARLNALEGRSIPAGETQVIRFIVKPSESGPVTVRAVSAERTVARRIGECEDDFKARASQELFPTDEAATAALRWLLDQARDTHPDRVAAIERAPRAELPALILDLATAAGLAHQFFEMKRNCAPAASGSNPAGTTKRYAQ